MEGGGLHALWEYVGHWVPGAVSVNRLRRSRVPCANPVRAASHNAPDLCPCGTCSHSVNEGRIEWLADVGCIEALTAKQPGSSRAGCSLDKVSARLGLILSVELPSWLQLLWEALPLVPGPHGLLKVGV